MLQQLNTFANGPKNCSLPVLGKMDVHRDGEFSMVTNLQKPQRIGYFSVKIDPETLEDVYSPDKSSLRYLALKPNGILHLTSRFDPSTIWPRSVSNLHILRWYMDNRDSFTLDENLTDLDPEFITNLRTLTAIMASPYEKKDDWQIIVVKLGGKLIIHDVPTESRKNAAIGQTEKQNASSYAGYMFESLITRRYDGKKCPTFLGGLRDSFFSVLVTQIGQHKVLYNARGAAAKKKSQLDKSINEIEFSEIKTRFYPRTFNSRELKIWSQCLLNDISHLVIGDRDSEFNVNLSNIRHFKRDNMPSNRKGWSPKTAVQCLDETLSFIKGQIIESNVVYRFSHSPNGPIICQQLEEPFTNFIPDWYFD